MSQPWSQRVSERYQVTLPADVAAWFDEQRWELSGGGEFNLPLSPEQVMDPEPGMIWPGFMLPDTLPLISNDYGDWLCLRIGSGGQIVECVYWSHAGGDWIPYGRTLAEALLYDALRGRETGGRTPGGNFSATADPSQDGWKTHVEWGWRQLGLATRDLPSLIDQSPEAFRQRIRDEGLARWAISRDEVLRHLDCELRLRSDYRVAQRIGVAWEPDYVQWMFDTDLIPDVRREELLAYFALEGTSLLAQDWEAAERAALRVMEARSDLGWAYDVAGWAAERRGDIGAAVDRYWAGLKPSLFADHTVRFRTHWVADGFAKFAAARLYELREQVPADWAEDPYFQLYWRQEPATLRPRVSEYWLEKAASAELAGEPAEAYQHYYRAGWDLGLDQLDGYARILEGLERTALSMGDMGQARIARLQRDLL